jgi:Holliday junction resolvase
MSYKKGVAYERELLYLLKSKGFAVMRAPSSGGKISPIDVVALKKGLILAIECKAWLKKPKLNSQKAKEIIDWAEKAGAIPLLAWRSKNGWQFSKVENPDIWFSFEQIMNIF